MRRLLPLACGIVLVDTIFFAALTPLLPHYSGVFGLAKSGAGLLAGSFAAGVLLAALPSGLVVARVGARPTILAGLAIVAVTSLAFGFAPTLWLLVGSRFLAGLGSALSWTATLTWLISSAPTTQRGKLLGMTVSAAVTGALVGPLVGSLAAAVGTGGAFATVASAAVALAGWVSVTPGPEPPAPLSEARTTPSVLDARLGRPFGLIALSPLLFSVLNVLVPLELARLGWSSAMIGGLFVAAGTVNAVAHPLFGRWADRRGDLQPIRAGLVGSIGLLLVLPWVSEPWTLALTVLLAVAAFDAMLVPGMTMLSRAGDEAGMAVGTSFALSNLAWALGYTIGAPLGGGLAQLAGDALSYLVLAVPCAAALFLTRPAESARPATGRRSRGHDGATRQSSPRMCFRWPRHR